MQDELYPPGMAPPGKKPAAAPARERKPVAAHAKAKDLLPQALRQSDLDPPTTEDSVPDFSEILPDDALPPMAESTSLPMAIPLAGQSPAAAIPMAIPLGQAQAGPTDGAAPLAASAQLRVGTAPRAAKVNRRRQSQSLRFLLLTIAGSIALVALLGVGYVLITHQAGEKQQVVAENPAVSPAAPSAEVPKAEVKPIASVGPVVTTPAPAAPLAPQTTELPVVPITPQPPTPVPATEPQINAAPFSPAPPPPAGPVPKVTRAEVQPLIKALEAAKSALSEQNFKVADAQLAKAESLAKLPKHLAAVARLKEVSKHVKQFRQAVVTAVQGMQAAETFQVGKSTQVSFVEATADKVVLRIAGMNKTYPLGDLPPGLALAIADFKLPANNPTSRVVKGAYLLLHKRADSETQDKARVLWQEAQAAGKDLAHLLPFLSDNYASFLQDASEATN